MTDQQENFEAPPDYGFRFEPPCSPDQPSHRRLTVVIHAVPTERHYDPESMQLNAVAAAGGIERLKIHHPWTFADSYRARGGPVILTDRKNEKVEAITFGGNLQIQSEEGFTTCVLQSPVPILAQLVEGSISTLLAKEVRILLAERRAAWDMRHRTPAGFQERLAAATANELYIACLAALDGKVQKESQVDYAPWAQLGEFLRAEIQAMTAAREWPFYVRPLDEIL